jgi:hypothetical protein
LVGDHENLASVLRCQRALNQSLSCAVGRDLAAVSDDRDHVQAPRTSCATAPVQQLGDGSRRAEVLNDAEGDDESGVVHGEPIELKISCHGLDPVSQAGCGGVLAEAFKRLRQQVHCGDTRVGAQPSGHQQSVPAGAGSKIVGVQRTGDQCQTVDDKSVRSSWPTPRTTGRRPRISGLVVSHGFAPSSAEVVVHPGPFW